MQAMNNDFFFVNKNTKQEPDAGWSHFRVTKTESSVHSTNSREQKKYRVSKYGSKHKLIKQFFIDDVLHTLAGEASRIWTRRETLGKMVALN